MFKLGIAYLFKQIMVKSKVRYVSKLSYIDSYSGPVSIASIKRFLNLQRKSSEEGYTCLITSCPICSRDSKENLKNFFVNKITGLFMCSSCKQHGEWNWLEDHYSNKKTADNNTKLLKSKNFQEELKHFLGKIDNGTELLGDSESFQLEEAILNKLKLPVTTFETLRSLKVRIDKVQENLYFPLENVKKEIVGYRKLNIENFSDITVPCINYGGLLIGRSKEKSTAVLVPTIFDFLLLYESKIRENIVCLPNGVDNLSQYVLPCLESFEKIILWFENDLKSWEAARHFAKKLDEKRCFLVRPSEENSVKAVTDRKQISSILDSSQQIWHQHITNFAALREDILSDLQNIDIINGVCWTRFPTLNNILKGHRRGELTILTGPTGSGKTTFISEYSLDLACQGVNTLWGSFEIKNSRLATTMLHQFSGIPLADNLTDFDKYADEFERLPIYFMTFFGSQNIKAVMEAIEHATYVYDIAHVIIDNVQFMMGVEEESKHIDRFWRQDILIAAFRTFATRKNCHVTLVIHPRKEQTGSDLSVNSIFGGAKATQEADNVLIIQHKNLNSKEPKKYLQICKNRYTGDLGVMPLEFDKASLSFSTEKKNDEASITKLLRKKSDEDSKKGINESVAQKVAR